MIIETAKFKIYFGDAQDAIHKTIDCAPSTIPLIAHEKLAPIAQRLAVDHLAFLNQTHGADGMIVVNQIPAFAPDGDYLITAQPNIGIGVLTADCLPIVIYDQKNHAAAAVHAGWRSTVARIAQETVNAMQKEIGTRPEDLQIFFGPSAKACCYQVTAEFKDHVASFAYADQAFKKDNEILYFDSPLFNRLQLQEMGIKESAISLEYNFCTMCDHRFYSHRRQGQAAGRQVTIASLNY